MAMPTTASAGTTGQVVGAGEAVIYQTNVAGTYVCNVDLSLMAAGDVIELHAYMMAITGGTAVVAYQMTYYGVQPTDDCMKRFPQIETTLIGDTNPLKWTINQTFGVARACPYNVEQYPAPATVSAGVTGQAIGLESVIYQTNALGTYICNVDLSLMAAGDVVELRAYDMAKTGGTAVVAYEMAFYGVQPTDDCMKRFPQIETTLTGDANPLKWTVKQNYGVARAFPYNVQQYT